MRNTIGTLINVSVFLALAISACTPQETIVTQAPPATDVPPTLVPTVEVLTEAPPTETAIPPTLEPIQLAGPAMEVGSTYLYVDGSLLVAVPGGPFLMGHGGLDNPEHEVFLSDFWIYRSPVTNSQYAACAAAGKCSPPNRQFNRDYGDHYLGNNPVVGVDHAQAAAYCDYVHGRLPTEAEWEKTARGPDGNLYPWGDAAPSCDLLNISTCVRRLTPVDRYPQGKSYYDALDMAGNVLEWAADWYSPTYYGESPRENPLGPDTGKRRSVRSTGYLSGFFEAESARRYNLPPDEQRQDLGFRCVVMDPQYFAPYCEMNEVYGADAPGAVSGSSLGWEFCPTISIVQGPFCGGQDGTFPQANVYFNISPPSTLMTISVPPPPECTPFLGETTKFTCMAPVTISASADCTVTVAGEPSCPPGFIQVGESCVAESGYPGECLAGFSFDSQNQCCAAQPGAGTSFPLCPVGTFYSDPPGACVPFPAAGSVTDVQTVGLLDCRQPTRVPKQPGDNTACQPPVSGCVDPVTGAQGRWCQSLCACIGPNDTCP